MSLRLPDVLCGALVLLLLIKLFSRARSGRYTSLRGPSRKSLVFGVDEYLLKSGDVGQVYEQWASEYGGVYEIPSALGQKQVVLCDPRALSHFYARDTIHYVQIPLAKTAVEITFGKGLIWADGESHRRQRKALAPAFSNAAIRKLTSVFFDSAYKLKAAWDAILESDPDGTVIDVEYWATCLVVDGIGLAGFSHDFGSLAGERSAVRDFFGSFGEADTTSVFSMIIFVLQFQLPFLFRLPTKRNLLCKRFRESTSKIADALLEKTGKEMSLGSHEISALGILAKAGSEDSLSKEEITAQIGNLLLAGVETSMITLTWALIELSRHPDKQQKLRDELVEKIGSVDPTWDQLVSSEYPYLDAVLHEVLRLHAPLQEGSRVAAADDIIPLSSPVTDRNGKAVEAVAIPKGTTVKFSTSAINRSEAIWGPDAKSFIPERWLDQGSGIPSSTQMVQGHRHLLSFIDGPRTCIGKTFALAELKAALIVLIRNFSLAFEDPKADILSHLAILPRPMMEGQVGAKVPLKVKRVE